MKTHPCLEDQAFIHICPERKLNHVRKYRKSGREIIIIWEHTEAILDEVIESVAITIVSESIV